MSNYPNLPIPNAGELRGIKEIENDLPTMDDEGLEFYYKEIVRQLNKYKKQNEKNQKNGVKLIEMPDEYLKHERTLRNEMEKRKLPTGFVFSL